ncbi:hypothetical protein EC912_101755 [Luteibacter rhizovicinus]|uniref:Uncharacterized protein n=1 Tax=Luteibacter rhizovicinus TaxID=242606 RepID=A0A4R3Z0K1_9GAMM|nr:hypothetical protein [Luteibacter rhizovicinus]TCV97738.1 hypothetical protein EC912_101755 [Luteibacter rhizovicinus]
MSDNTNYKIIRAFNETRLFDDKKDASKKHGFQTCAIVKGEGRMQEYEEYFNPSKQSHFLPPGDYEVVMEGVYLDRDNRRQVKLSYVALKTAAKAA